MIVTLKNTVAFIPETVFELDWLEAARLSQLAESGDEGAKKQLAAMQEQTVTLKKLED